MCTTSIIIGFTVILTFLLHHELLKNVIIKDKNNIGTSLSSLTKSVRLFLLRLAGKRKEK